MRKNKLLWLAVLIISVILLALYGVWAFSPYGLGNYYNYGGGYYGGGMMGRWFNTGGSQPNGGNKLSVDTVKSDVNAYIKGYGNNLQISDIFVYKDTDYYVSVEEKDTGRGAIELLVNPYTGRVYPEYGPNMMWNQKYGMHDGYGMMGGFGMMGGLRRYGGYNPGSNVSGTIARPEAVRISDQFVKNKMGKEFSVPGDGHEFYGYYTFHIDNGGKTVGMLSVNYYTGDVWYHDWHGQIETVISDHKG